MSASNDTPPLDTPPLFVVVMAGGSGTRFWPLSRAVRPKQLLRLASPDETLLGATVRRVRDIAERVLIVTSERLERATYHALMSETPPTEAVPEIMAEPIGRNTAPCIGWACVRIARIDPSAVCAVLPADHHIGDEPAYRDAIARAARSAKSGGIVTIGIRPSRPETGYGYLQMGEARGDGVYECVRFVEKPTRERAEELLAGGDHLWNSGMFFFRAEVMLAAIRAHLPELADALDRIASAPEAEELALIDALYPTMPAISIDHGVMEKVDGVRVVPADVGWSDLGGFATAWELADKDAEGNALSPDAIALDAKNNLVRASDRKLVALIGVDDLVVIDTDDALLIVPRERAQEVKRIVSVLAERRDPRL
ncbi:MAG: mannose-1-phosphate guanylyltransferase [Sandaracinaceae bacterium]